MTPEPVEHDMANWTDVKNNMSRWMGQIDGETPLSMITIPGTHDTMTWQGTSSSDLSQTQDRALQAGSQGTGAGTQLEAGVRFFDIRLGLYTDPNMGFALFHGSDDIRYDDGYTYTHTDPSGAAKQVTGGRKFFQEAVLERCLDFLRTNPTECILMTVKQDHFDMPTFASTFEAKV
ncbi:MAG: 1-phosphatidylinositol phosphodiesterase [Myxococcota bacterium]